MNFSTKATQDTLNTLRKSIISKRKKIEIWEYYLSVWRP